MKLARLTFSLVVVTVTAACAAERVAAPKPATSSLSSVVTGFAPQVPLLFVVDGVRLQRDQIPSLTSDQVAAVRVIKGSAALKQYGPDASYGVVVITTKGAAASARKS